MPKGRVSALSRDAGMVLQPPDLPQNGQNLLLSWPGAPKPGVLQPTQHCSSQEPPPAAPPELSHCCQGLPNPPSGKKK